MFEFLNWGERLCGKSHISCLEIICYGRSNSLQGGLKTKQQRDIFSHLFCSAVDELQHLRLINDHSGSFFRTNFINIFHKLYSNFRFRSFTISKKTTLIYNVLFVTLFAFYVITFESI